MYVTVLFRVERQLPRDFFVFLIGAPRAPKNAILGPLRQIYVVLQFISDLNEIYMAT